ncbi:MAG: alpha/beta fold hydrolase [Bacteroidota bacterium]
MTLEKKSIPLDTGVEIRYVEQGDASGTSVIFLHGVSDSWHSFEMVLPHLPPSIRAFALSQRGHGDSSRPESAYCADDFAADVAAFMDAVGIRAGVIVGHSMGSAVARRFAIAYTDRTLGLVIVSSFATPRNSPVVHELWGVVSEMSDPVDPAFVSEFQESTLTRPVPRDFFETIVQESLKVPAHVWKGVIGNDVKEDYLANVEEIAAPTLIMWGDQDEHCPRTDQETLVDSIPNARLVVYPDAGHGLHWEYPERFASDIAGFVNAVAS